MSRSSTSTPDEMTAQLRFLTLPPIPELPDPLRGKSLVDVTGAFIYDLAEGEQLMRPLREIDGAVWDTWGVQPAAELRVLDDGVAMVLYKNEFMVYNLH